MHHEHAMLTLFVRAPHHAAGDGVTVRVLPPGALWPDQAAIAACDTPWIAVCGETYEGPRAELAAATGALVARVRAPDALYGPTLAASPLAALVRGRVFETGAAAWRRDALSAAGGFPSACGGEADRAAALALAARGYRIQVLAGDPGAPAGVDAAAARAVIATADHSVWAQSAPIGPTAALLAVSLDAGARAVAAGGPGTCAADGLAQLNPAEIGEVGFDGLVLDSLARGAGSEMAAIVADSGFSARLHAMFDAFVAAGAPARLIDRTRALVCWKLGAPLPARGMSLTALSLDVNAPLPEFGCDAPQAFLFQLQIGSEPFGVMDAVHPGGAAPDWLALELSERLALEPTWRLARIRAVRRRASFWAALARRTVSLMGEVSDGGMPLTERFALRVRQAHGDAIRRAVAPRAHAPKPARPQACAPGGPARRVTALMYHAITPRGAADRAYSVRAERFAAQIEWLAANGYRWLSAQAWAHAVRAQRSVAEKHVVITFDDAYVDFAEHAWPVLRRHGFSATMFTPSSWVGRSPAWFDSDAGLTIMSWEMMRGLAREGCEFGSHSATHRHLTALPVADLVEEMSGSRKALEDSLGAAVETIAYPFGDNDAMVRAAARSAGFVGGYANWGGASAITDDPMNLKRIEVATDDDLDAFIVKVAPP